MFAAAVFPILNISDFNFLKFSVSKVRIAFSKV